jgi:hypothetical protein
MACWSPADASASPAALPVALPAKPSHCRTRSCAPCFFDGTTPTAADATLQKLKNALC